MIAFPFSNAFAIERSKRGKQGEYLSMYVIAFSIAHIFAHYIGLQLVDKFGYENTWNIMMGIGIVGILLLFLLQKLTRTSN